MFVFSTLSRDAAANNGALSGCRTAGYRFCLWKCMNKHMRGLGKLKRQKVEVQWKDGEWYAHGMG